MRKVEKKRQIGFVQKLSAAFLSFSLVLGFTLPFASFVHAEGLNTVQAQALVQQLEQDMHRLHLLEDTLSLAQWQGKIAVTVQLKEEPTREGMVAPRVSLLDEKSLKVRDLYARTKQAEFLQQVNAVVEPDPVTKNHVTLVDNAFTTELSYEQLSALAEIPGIARLYHNYPVIARPTMAQPVPHTEAQPSGFAFRMAFDPATAKGQGQVLSIIDSGFDSDHKAMFLSEETVPKLSEEDVRAAIDEHKLKGKYYSKKIPYGYNYADQNQNIEEPGESHGTHVAGIAAGQPDEHGRNAGVAPEAQVLAMRVFGAGQKGTSPMIYVKAIDDSVKLKASSINMSLGSTYASKNDLDNSANITGAIAAAKAIGATVNISAGNDGYAHRDADVKPKAEDPHYATIGTPSLADESISVASIESLTISSPVMHVKGEPDLSYLPGRVVPVDSIYDQELNVVDVKRAIVKDGQNDLADADLQDKAALIERGEISFVDKVNNVAAKGAKLAIIFNHAQGGNDYVNMALDGTTIPAISLKREDGLALLAKIRNGEQPIITVTKEVGGFSYGSAGKLSDFSSWGPTPEFNLKPEITATGGNVYAAQPDDTYANMSGTSMAAPQVTGAIAILNQRLSEDDSIEQSNGEKRYYFMKNILMSTAVPHDKDQGDSDPYSSPRKQGAGVMSLDNMLKTKAYATVAGADPETDLAKVGLGAIGSSAAFKLRVYNISKTETLRFKPVTTVQTDRLDETNPVFLVPVGTRRIVDDIEGDEITIAPGQTAEVPVSFDISSKVPVLEKEFVNGFFVEGFVRLQSLTPNQPDLSVPYVGFHGTKTHPNFYDAPVIEKPIYDYTDLSAQAQNFPRYYRLEGAGDHPFTALTTTTDRDKTVVLGELTAAGDPVRRFDKEQLFFSPNGDRHYDVVQFQGSFTGHYRDAFIRVLNEAKEEVYVGNKPYGIGQPNYYLASKPETKRRLVTTNRYWSWDGRNLTYQTVPDGRYTLEFSYRSAVATSQPHTLQFNLVVDTTYPELTAAAYDDGSGTFSAKVVETGSGLAEATLMSPTEDAGTEYTKIDVSPEGLIRLNRPLSELSQSKIYLRDRAGNKKTLPLITLLAGDEIGKVKVLLKNSTGGLEKIDQQLYRVKAVSTKDGREYTDLEALPFGEYKIKLELNSVVYEAAKTEETVTLQADKKTVEVVFVVNKLKGIRTGVRVDFSPRGLKYPGTPKLKATNQATQKSAYLPYSDLYGFLFSFNGELTAGTWRFEVEDLSEGWSAIPSSWELTINDTDKRAPDRTVTLFKGDVGYIRPVAVIEDGGFDPGTLKYNAYNGEKIYEGVETVPVGEYVVFPAVVPEGYYVTPVWQQAKVGAKEVAAPTFHFMKITPERMGKVKVETKMADGSQAIEATYKALRLQSDVPAERLEELPFGTWFIRPDKYDPRYVANPLSQKVELSTENREATVTFTWSKLNQVGKKGSIFFYINQGEPSQRTAFNDAVGEAMEFELEDMDSGEKKVVKAKPTFSGMVTLADVPFGYYAVRPQAPEGFHITPAVQYVRVDKETGTARVFGPEGMIDFVAHRGQKDETSGIFVDKATNVTVDVRNTVLEGVVQSLHVEAKSGRQIGNEEADVYDIYLLDKEGRRFTQYEDLAEFKAKVFLPLKEGKDATKAVAYYLPEGKEPVKLTSEVVTMHDKSGLAFTVTHFSEYGIGYAAAPAPAPGPGDQPAPVPGTGDQPAPGIQPKPVAPEKDHLSAYFPSILGEKEETAAVTPQVAKDNVPRTGEATEAKALPFVSFSLAFVLAGLLIRRYRKEQAH